MSCLVLWGVERLEPPPGRTDRQCHPSSDLVRVVGEASILLHLLEYITEIASFTFTYKHTTGGFGGNYSRSVEISPPQAKIFDF